MAKTTSKTFRCPFCHGTGSRRLPDIYADTLDSVRRLKPATVIQVHADLSQNGKLVNGSLPSLVHKRMMRLETWGLIRKVRRVSAKEVESPARQRVWLYDVA